MDTGAVHEATRHVYAALCEGLRTLAETITASRVFLKVCASDEAVARMLPPRWSLRPASWLMTGEGGRAVGRMPDGYRCEVTAQGASLHARILDTAGVLAASGHATDLDGYRAFDRIETTPAHRRRGLGAAVMGELLEHGGSAESLPVLVATAEGRALYRALGWRERSPYATAIIQG